MIHFTLVFRFDLSRMSMRASRRFPISLLPIVYIIRYMSSRLSNDDEREPNEHCEQIANTDSSFVKRMGILEAILAEY